MFSQTIIAILKNEHKEVGALLKQAIATSTHATAKRLDLFTRINDALSAHTAFEEEQLYPVLARKADTKDTALEAIEEHQQIKILLRDLARTDCDDESWKAKMTVLMEDVRHHVKEEEQLGGLFSDLKAALDHDELVALAKEYESSKSDSVR